jgi:hypothetical protein
MDRSTARHYSNWIDGFVVATSSIVSPDIFRKWAALAAVSGAMRRSSFTQIQGQKVFPNFYIMFVATPGKGKSNAIKHARRIISNIPSLSLSPASLTEQALYEVLESAGTKSAKSANWIDSIESPLIAMIDEYGTLIKSENTSFMDFLTDLYDCPDIYEYRTKTSGHNVIERPCLTLIGGCTPDWIKGVFTDAALERGFASRMILVYSDEDIYQPLFGTPVVHDSIEEKNLIADLTQIANTNGEFHWHPDAAAAFTEWYNSGLEPKPQDTRLQHYITRRIVHLTKIAMVVRAAQDDSKIITESDYQEAKSLLLETEASMPKAVESLGSNPYYEQVKLIELLVKAWHVRHHNPMPEQELRARLARDVPSTYTDTLINSVIMAGKMEVLGEGVGRRFFTPPKGWEPERGAVARRSRIA